MRKSLFILFFIKENAPKKNGLCTVLVRLTIEKEYLSFSTKLDINPKVWNKDTGRVKVKKQEISEQNVYLDDLHKLITEKYDDLFDNGGIITPQQLKDAIFNTEVKKDPNTIISIFSKHNDDMSRLIGREVVKSTHTRYVKTLSRLKQFLQEVKNVDDMPMKDVTPMFIRDFEIYLKTIGKCTD
ncbi:MAG: phage integrase SAM-like domain-containing protein, partial [Rikenellaceae bacterium]